MTNLINFPNWKLKNVTAAERFDELATQAREKPNQFGHVLVAFIEILPNGNEIHRYISTLGSRREEIGLLAQMIDKVIRDGDVSN